MPLDIDLAIGDELVRLRVGLGAIGRAMKVIDTWAAAIACHKAPQSAPGMLTSIRR